MTKPVPGHVKYMCAATFFAIVGIGNQLLNGDTQATTAWYLAAGTSCLKGLSELCNEGNLNFPGLKRGLFAIWKKVTPCVTRPIRNENASVAVLNS